MRKRCGFTLAEVLITLGIIGVVAAMTIPTLIANTNGARARSQFKKSISTLNQAVKMATAQADVDFSSPTRSCIAGDTSAEKQTLEDGKLTICGIFNSTLTGIHYNGNQLKLANGAYYNSSIKRAALPSINLYITYTLSDGTIVGFPFTNARCDLPIGTPLTSEWIDSHVTCKGFIDINGISLPNKEVTCTLPDNKKNTASTKVEEPCIVKNNAENLTDIFPIVFHNGTVEPGSDAAKYILSTTK